MSLLTDNGTDVFKGTSIHAGPLTFENVLFGFEINIASYKLQDSAYLYYSVTINSDTISGRLAVGELVQSQIDSYNCSIQYTTNSKFMFATPRSDRFTASVMLGNTSSLDSATDVLFAEGEWASFPYTGASDSILSNAYEIPRAPGMNRRGQLSSPYWLPLRLAIQDGESVVKDGYWNFASGYYETKDGDRLCYIEWSDLGLVPERSVDWPSGTITIRGSHWIAVSPHVDYAPPKLLLYNNNLLSYSSGSRLLSRQRGYSIANGRALSGADTRYMTNCRPGTGTYNTAGWVLNSQNCSSSNIESSSWGNTLWAEGYDTQNGFAAPSPYWQTSQSIQGALADPSTFEVLESNNQVMLKTSGTIFSDYSNLIPMFIHAYSNNVSIIWNTRDSDKINPKASNTTFDSSLYISNGEIIGANSNTCMLYAYNSSRNILSFAYYGSDTSRRRAFENAICGAQQESKEFYINNMRYCVISPQHAPFIWEYQAASAAEDYLFNLKHYEVNIEISQGKVLINNIILLDSNGDDVSSSDLIISGEHYRTSS